MAKVSEDQSNVASSFTRLRYMMIMDKNSFSWRPKPDTLLTLDEDIILESIQLEPVNNRSHFM